MSKKVTIFIYSQLPLKLNKDSIKKSNWYMLVDQKNQRLQIDRDDKSKKIKQFCLNQRNLKNVKTTVKKILKHFF